MIVQLDLFLDSRAVVLANDAVHAIVEPRRRARCAVRDRVACRSGRLSGFAIARNPRARAGGVAAAGARRNQHPLGGCSAGRRDRCSCAGGVRSGSARGLAPFFRDLAETSRGLAYEASCSKAHRAWLSLRCGDWEQAEVAALAIPGANEIPDALHWLTVARHRLRGLPAARPTLFALAWRDPPRFAGLIDDLQDEALERDFKRFNDACEWTNTAVTELSAWFPAWHLLEHPAAAADLDPSEGSTAPPVRAARLVARILERERQDDWKALVALRDQLRRLSVDLFSLYMARREVSRWR